MRIAITGGTGDLGTRVSSLLLERGDTPVLLDVRPQPRAAAGGAEYHRVDITDRAALKECLNGCRMVIHIAAWHGIHEARRDKDVFEFWDLNVTGTFNVFQLSSECGIKKVILLSSTSIDEPYEIYGHTKVLGEEIARTYFYRHGIDVITLRPRAFIPADNGDVYSSYVDWLKWFWSGAVHIDDVTQSVLKSVDFLSSAERLDQPYYLTVDSAYDYQDNDLENWDADGPGSTFRRYYPQYYDLVIEHGLEPAKKPRILDIAETRRVLSYEPKFSLKDALKELAYLSGVKNKSNTVADK